MRKYFFDLDGTITEAGGLGISEVKVPWWVLWFVLSLYKPGLTKKLFKLLTTLKKEEERLTLLLQDQKE